METSRTALVAMLIVLLAPSASAAGIVPALVDTCLSSAIATCLDSVSPRLQPSRVLPPVMQPASAPAAPEAPPAIDPPATTAPDASAGPAATPSEPAATAPEIDAAAPTDAILARTLLTMVVILAALGLLLVVLVLDAKERKRARRTTIADAMRARAMQDDIDAVWRTARPTTTEART